MSSLLKDLWNSIRGRAPEGIPLENGWKAVWIARDSFELRRDGYAYEIFAEPSLRPGERLLRLPHMPGVWLPPHDKEPVTPEQRSELIRLAGAVVATQRQTLTLTEEIL